MKWCMEFRTMPGPGGTIHAQPDLATQPEGQSEAFAEAALAAQALLPPDIIGDRFQGGPFCSQEFEGRLQTESFDSSFFRRVIL